MFKENGPAARDEKFVEEATQNYEKAMDTAIDAAAKANSLTGRLKNALNPFHGKYSEGSVDQLTEGAEEAAKDAKNAMMVKKLHEFQTSTDPETQKKYEEYSDKMKALATELRNERVRLETTEKDGTTESEEEEAARLKYDNGVEALRNQFLGLE